MNLVLNNQQWLMCLKLNQTKPNTEIDDDDD